MDVSPKNIYLGEGKVKKVYLGNTKIRPLISQVTVDYLVVGGGGGGTSCRCNSRGGGGGGGGQVLFGTLSSSVNPSCPTLAVSVGAGGKGSTQCSSNGTCAVVKDTDLAQPSCIVGVNCCVVALGGCPGGIKGSAAGTGCYYYTTLTCGGRSGSGCTGVYGGGGAGGNATSCKGGVGLCGYGEGGNSTYYYNTCYTCCYTGPAGAANTGNGGGGSRGAVAWCGGDGGSGIVKICYPTDGSYGFSEATGGTVTTEGSYKVHTFTEDGTFTIVS